MAIEVREADATEWTELGVKDAAGAEVDDLYIDNTLVWQAEIPIDFFDRDWLGYEILDSGQATLPQIVANEGYNNPDAMWCPPDSPNGATNLDDDNPAFDPTQQDRILDNYLQPGDIAEVYLRPPSFSAPDQFRFALFTDDYYGNENHIRLRWTEGYWRLEQGSSLYDGTGDSESFTGFNNNGNAHRLVLDTSSFPTIECHLWDAGTGSFIGTVGGTGDGNPSTAGHYVWFNDSTEMYVSDFRKIDADDFTAGQDL